MTVYIFAIVYCLFLIFVSSKINSRVILFLFCVPLILFSIFRGTSGSDTVNYIYLYRDINEKIDASLSITGEPVIYLLMYICREIFDGGLLLFYSAYAILYGLILTVILSKYHKYKVFLLTVGVALIIDGLTNTLRVSVAYLFFLLSVNSRYYYYFVTMSVLTHATGILLAGLKIIFEKIKPKLNVAFILRVTGLLLLFLISLIVIEKFAYLVPRIDDKINQYQELKSISITSGLSDIFLINCLLLLGSIYNRESKKEIYLDLTMILILSVALFFFGQLSIASYRFFKIIILAITVSPFITNPKKKIPTILLVCIGLLYTLNFIKIISGSDAYQVYGESLYQLYNMHNLY